MSESAAPASSSFRDFSFPLNVYAFALLLEEGRVDYLHYGLFAPGETDAAVAQRRSTDLLLDRLPAPPCRILEVGIGLGKTFELLRERGYAVHGITPDEPQATRASRQLGGAASITCTRFEDFVAADGSFDAIVFQESSQYIDPVVIFDKSLDLLAEGGSLLVADEFARRLDEPIQTGLALLDDFLRLAQRFGFELAEQLDLSSRAAPTLDYLLRVTRRHRQRLIDELGLTAMQLEQLEESNRTYQSRYGDGTYGYALLKFIRRQAPRWRLRLIDRTHQPQALALSEAVFGRKPDQGLWEWKYGSGRGHAVGAFRDGRLIAHYGGMARPVLYFGEPHLSVQIGDVMVEARERGLLTRNGPFFLVAATFAERYTGFGRRYLVGFGFPTERAMRVAERLGLYAQVGGLVEISWPKPEQGPSLQTRISHLNQDDPSAPTAVAELWRRMAHDLRNAIVGVRDWPYLLHRYYRHPCQRYAVMAVRSRISGRLRAVLVMRRDGDEVELVDVIAPLAEIARAIAHALRHCGKLGAERMFCRITENFASVFEVANGTRNDLGIRIPTSIWTRGPAPSKIAGRWWLMSGDTDYR